MPPVRVRAALGLSTLVVALAGCGGDIAGSEDSVDAGPLTEQSPRDASGTRDGGARDASVVDAASADDREAASDAGSQAKDAGAQPTASGCGAHDYALCEDFE